MPATHTVERPATLLAFLSACRPEVKRTRIRQWLKYGSIQVNGQSVTRSDHPLQTGDLVSIRPRAKVTGAGPSPPGVRVVFEDGSLMVIEKPAGLLSMASAKERDATAYAFLTDYVRRGTGQAADRIWIVHRLDRETSGLMVFAKTEAAKVALASRLAHD